MRAAMALALSFALAGCASWLEARRTRLRPWGLAGREFMVATDHPQASVAGARMLANGGNAVDAAVAAAFALAVARPSNAGLGGGGFMLIRMKGQPPVALDFRETAPSGASLRDYAQNRVIVSTRAVHGPWAVAVPGQVRGLAQALQAYGTKTLPEALAPAIELAQGGARVDAYTSAAMAGFAKAYNKSPEVRARYAELGRIFLKDGRAYRAGEPLGQPDLAATLRRIAAEGPDAFYRGETARRILAEISRLGGNWSEADLSGYAIASRTPLSGTYRGYEVLGMPPPSAGGACLLEILHVLEGYDLRQLGPAGYARVLAEAMKHAFAGRAAFLGDPDRAPEVLEDARLMASPEYAAALRKSIGEKTSPPESYGAAGGIKIGGGTTALSVIDKEGNAVALTETVNLPFGSWIVPPGTGVVLNDSMDDFSLRPGIPRLPGVRSFDRNALLPGRRPLSSMAPTLVLKDGRVVLSIGASGGSMIISAVAQALVRVLDFGERPDLALAEPRIHHQWSPNVLYAERGLPGEVRSALKGAGHVLAPFPLHPACQMVYASDGLFGASDPGKGGRPVGR